ncbi:NUDIX hydrolase [Hahella sp. SMD15-11]|uniref:Phosphatase NudJ n=1 Tax=Thermohahella caldifontis TaxID=3142973 RepID=A0AB39UXM5_9GAMM
MQRWTPRATVALVVEKDGKFLVVKEKVKGKPVYNQPAGHIEKGESILEAALREALEETAWKVELTDFLGIYVLHVPARDVTYHRYAFVARPVERKPLPLDPDILSTHWLTAEELRAQPEALRSPLVMQCIDDYLAGRRLPLDTIRETRLDI